MQLGPVRVPGRGHRALGTHPGAAPGPAHPAPGTAEPRPSVTAGKGHGGQGQGPARQWHRQGPKSLAVPEGVVPRDRAAGCHPCAVRAQGCPLLGQRAGCAHACAHAQLCAHAQTRGAPAAPSRGISQLLAGRSAPAAPPRPALPCPLHESPRRPWEAIKREPGLPPRHRARHSHEGVAAVPARLHGRPGGGSKGRLARGSEGAGAESAGAGPESHGHDQGRLQQGAGVGGGAAGQAVAVGQRRAGEAAAGVAQGAAGRAAEEDSGLVASPGAARALSGLGTPGSPPLSWCSQIKRG